MVREEAARVDPLRVALIVLLMAVVTFMSNGIPFSIVSANVVLTLVLANVGAPTRTFNNFVGAGIIVFMTVFIVNTKLAGAPLVSGTRDLIVHCGSGVQVLVFLSYITNTFLNTVADTATATTVVVPLLMNVTGSVNIDHDGLLCPSVTYTGVTARVAFLNRNTSGVT